MYLFFINSSTRLDVFNRISYHYAKGWKKRERTKRKFRPKKNQPSTFLRYLNFFQIFCFKKLGIRNSWRNNSHSFFPNKMLKLQDKVKKMLKFFTKRSEFQWLKVKNCWHTTTKVDLLKNSQHTRKSISSDFMKKSCKNLSLEIKIVKNCKNLSLKIYL